MRRFFIGFSLSLVACQSSLSPSPSPVQTPVLSSEDQSPQTAVNPVTAAPLTAPGAPGEAPAAPSEAPRLKPEWTLTGSAREQLLGTSTDFSGYLTLTSQNRILDPIKGLSYQVGSEPWQSATGQKIEGPANLSEKWTLKVYALQSNGERYGFPLAQTRYAGDFSQVHWNGVTDEGQRAPQGRYEIVAIPEGLQQAPLKSPLQLLNSAPPDESQAPPPDYATEYLLARFHDPQLAAKDYTVLDTNTAGISRVKTSDSPDAETRASALLSLAQRLQNDPNVRFAEPDLIYDLGWTPNDPRLPEQYALQRVQAEAAWEVETGKDTVVIAIVDTGVDTNHPDLRPQLVPGWNAIGHNTNVSDDHGHGTHCAGIAAAAGDDNTGIVGLAPHTRIMPVKVMDASGRGSSLAIAEGIRWAADQGAQVISLSLGTTMGSSVIRDALVYAVGKGASVVAAMGNDGGNIRSYPAAYASEIEGVIAVGATDNNDARAYFSNYGTWITVTAPGQGILSTLPRYSTPLSSNTSGYGPLNGTSMATPYVAGLAGLLKSQQPQRSPADIQAAIIQGAEDLGSSGFDPQFGHGRINAARSLGLNLPVSSPTPTPVPSGTPGPQPTATTGTGVPGGLILDIN